MKQRVKLAGWLFERSRITRTLFVLAVWPPVYIADRLRGDEPLSLRRGMQWARDGEYAFAPTIPTSDAPAVVGRRRSGLPETDPRCPGRVIAYADGRTGRCMRKTGHDGTCA